MEKPCRFCPRLFSLLTIPVFMVLYVYTAVAVLIALPFAWTRRKRLVRFMIIFWSRSVFFILGKRLRVLGKENLQLHKQYILVANHASLFDILAIMAVHPGVVWFGREHLLKIPLFGNFLRMIDYIPMKAGDLRNTKGMITQLSENANRGTVAIFPEGTRTTDGQLNRFKKGFIHVHRATNLGILPVTLKGFYHLKPKNRFWINFNSRLGVVVHQPIHPHELATLDDHQIIEKVKSVIESAYE